ncbi:MAG: hypothetical protein O3A00_00185 [Planctomycetota bacterium]|nr:hypothetical protein [Planctomycetota bacterium]
MDSSDLQQFLADTSIRLDRTVRHFSSHPNEDYALQQVLAFCSHIARQATQFNLPQTSELAKATEQLVARMISRQAAFTPEVCLVLFDVFDQIRDLLVDGQATGAEYHSIRPGVLPSVRRLWTQLEQLVLVFPGETTVEKPAKEEPPKSDLDVDALQQSWMRIAERSDLFSLQVLEAVAGSSARHLLPRTVDEDLQRQFMQLLATTIRFANSPDLARSFITQIARRTGLSNLAAHQLADLRAIVLQAVTRFLGDDRVAARAAWIEFLSVTERWICGVVPELRQAG